MNRFLALLLAVITLMGSISVTSIPIAAAEIIAGDINSDGSTNIMDILRLASLVSGWDVNYDSLAVDITGDGKTNAFDLVRLAKHVAGWSVDMFYNGELVVEGDMFVEVPVTQENFGSIFGEMSSLDWSNGLTADGVTMVSFKLPATVPAGSSVKVHIKGKSVGNFRVWLLDSGVATFSNQVNVGNDLGFNGGIFEYEFLLDAYDFDGVGSEAASQIAFKAPSYDSMLEGFNITDISISLVESQIPDEPIYGYDANAPKLKDVFADKFDVGCAINSWNLNNTSSDEYKMITSQFNIFTMENEMKIDALQPSEGNFNFSGADKFVDFCTKNGYKMRGHTLVWHSQCPDWFFFDGSSNASAELVIERMKNHITTVMTRYKGKVNTWDVCNEIMEDNGSLRNSYWLQRVGDLDGDGDMYDYIEIAYKTAHEVDPNARLIINDYNLEWSESKARAYYDLVKSMMEDGIHIDGVGFQCHIGVNTDINTFRRNMEIIAELKEIDPDFVIEITELDMSVYNWNDNIEVEYTDELSAKQASKYRELFNMFNDFADRGILDTVVFWGLSDNNSWLNKENQKNYPMLFDRSYKTKDCFWEVIATAG